MLHHNRHHGLAELLQLIRSPAFNRVVRRLHKKVHEMRHGPDLEEMGGTKIDGQSILSNSSPYRKSLTAGYGEKMDVSVHPSSYSISEMKSVISYGEQPRNEHPMQARFNGPGYVNDTSVHNSVGALLGALRVLYTVGRSTQASESTPPYAPRHCPHLECSSTTSSRIRIWASSTTTYVIWLSFHPETYTLRTHEASLVAPVLLLIHSRSGQRIPRNIFA